MDYSGPLVRCELALVCAEGPGREQEATREGSGMRRKREIRAEGVMVHVKIQDCKYREGRRTDLTYVSLDLESRISCPFDHVEKAVVSWYQSLLLPL
jgi:hypothetical protein